MIIFLEKCGSQSTEVFLFDLYPKNNAQTHRAKLFECTVPTQTNVLVHYKMYSEMYSSYFHHTGAVLYH